MLAEKVKARMNALGMTQADLARESGLSTGHIADIVNGKKGVRASLPTLEALSKGLAVKGDYFFSSHDSHKRVKTASHNTNKRVRRSTHAQVE